jgi:hypothetical protein
MRQPQRVITTIAPIAPGNGSSRRWTRLIRGRRYSFTAILMPDGERRYSASRLDGNDARFASAWTRVLWWTFPASK